MAFFQFTLPGPGQYFKPQTVKMENYQWSLCRDHDSLHRNSLRVLEELCHRPGELTLAFSGGSDSWFLALCLHRLVQQGRVPRDRMQIWMGDYTVGGQSATPGGEKIEEQLGALGLKLNRVTLEVGDPQTQRLLTQKFHDTASHNRGSIAQWVLMDRFPGKVVVAEAGPIICDAPRPVGHAPAGGDCVYLNALEYERDGRMVFHYSDAELWGSWLVPENLGHRTPPIRRDQFLSLTQEQRHLYQYLHHWWRDLLYSRAFPEHSQKFLWKRPSWRNLLECPELEGWRRVMQHYLWEKDQHLRIRLDDEQWYWSERYYQKVWIPLHINR